MATFNSMLPKGSCIGDRALEMTVDRLLGASSRGKHPVPGMHVCFVFLDNGAAGIAPLIQDLEPVRKECRDDPGAEYLLEIGRRMDGVVLGVMHSRDGSISRWEVPSGLAKADPLPKPKVEKTGSCIVRTS
jgi:hypothetical protein